MNPPNGKPITMPNGHAPKVQQQTVDLRPIVKGAGEAAAQTVAEMLNEGLDPRYERAAFQVAMEFYLTTAKAQIHVSAEIAAHQAMVEAQKRAQGIIG